MAESSQPGSVDHDGVAIHYEIAGSGPPLVLQHGRLGSGRFWFDARYVDTLVATNQLIVIDARGHGRSDKPTDPEAYRAEDMAGDVVAVLDHLDIEVADFLGYSMGGRIGFATSALFGSRINALAAGGAGPYGPARNSEGELRLAATLSGGMAAYVAEMERMLHRSIAKADRDRLLANDAAALGALATATAEWTPVVDALAANGGPILLFGGTNDPIWPLIEQAHGELPGSRLQAIGPFGHGEDIRRRDLVLPVVVDFLAARGLQADR